MNAYAPLVLGLLVIALPVAVADLPDVDLHVDSPGCPVADPELPRGALRSLPPHPTHEEIEIAKAAAAKVVDGSAALAEAYAASGRTAACRELA